MPVTRSKYPLIFWRLFDRPRFVTYIQIGQSIGCVVWPHGGAGDVNSRTEQKAPTRNAKYHSWQKRLFNSTRF